VGFVLLGEDRALAAELTPEADDALPQLTPLLCANELVTVAFLEVSEALLGRNLRARLPYTAGVHS
jgi:hypothetical protein